jgi:RNA polymerase subunit RPABC4/transcription elongation factor Spt4
MQATHDRGETACSACRRFREEQIKQCRGANRIDTVQGIS